MANEWRANPGPQTDFLASPCYEVLYGGAAGGGKSESLIVAPLRWVSHASFRGIIMRRTFPELEKSIIDRSRQLYPSVVGGAQYNAQEKLWRMPGGSRIYFGHCEHEQSVYQYQGAEFSYIGFDELTHFTEKQYTYMLSRARSSAGLPIRIRSTSNPGGPGQEWVMKRWAPWLNPESPTKAAPGEVLWYCNTEDGEKYVPKGTPDALSRTFIPAPLDSNPHLTKNDPGYRQRLMGLDRVTRMQLLDGNWLVTPSAGAYFKRQWFQFIDATPVSSFRVRRWDLASIEGGGDYTVGVLMSRLEDGRYVIEDIIRGQWRPEGVQRTVRATAEIDGIGVRVVLPQDPGQAGVAQCAAYSKLMAGFNVRFERETGDKVTRAQPLSAQCEAGNVLIKRATWNDRLMQELEAFPEEGVHDDQVDACSGGFNALVHNPARLGPTEWRAPSFRFGSPDAMDEDDMPGRSGRTF